MAAPLRPDAAAAAALALFAATALHANTGGDTTARVMARVHADYASAHAALEQRTAECLKQRTRAVDPILFRGLDLSQRQIEVAAYVLSERAMNACEAPAKGQFALAISAYQHVARHYGQVLPADVARADEQLMAQRWRLLEKEIGEYTSLSDTQRLRLESHVQLRTPFDFTGLLDQLRDGR